MIYVQEAHPTDGWQVDANVSDSVYFRQHQSYEEREEVAGTCTLDLKISVPTLVEEINNEISTFKRSDMRRGSWALTSTTTYSLLLQVVTI